MKNIVALIAVCCLIMTTTALAQDKSYRPGASNRTSQPRPKVPSRWRGGPNQRRVAQQRHVSPASHQHVEVVDGGEYIEGEYIVDGGVGCSGCDGGCDSCGIGAACGSCDGAGCDSCTVGSYCGSCSAPHRFCICFPSHGWVHAEYLNWWHSGMRVPALVTTSPTGTARNEAGVLGLPTTTTLFGDNEDVLSGERSGFRIRFGWWLSNFPCWGIEGEYVGFDEETESFFQQSTGDPIITRPFFDTTTGENVSELVAFPNVVTGSINVDVTSAFDGAAFRFRRQLCCSNGCCFSPICCKTVPYSSRLDATIGYRFWELDESLQVREQLQLQTTSPTGSFDITDTFATRNQFNGAELGLIWQGRRGWWSLDALMRLGIGNTHQTVTISGSTQIVENGTTTNAATGILAQRTNIGTFDRDKFMMVPELGLTLGYQFTRRLRLTMGYSAIYWGNVVRPGDQVDLVVNSNLFAPELNPFEGALRPQFDFVETDYWVHGLSFGGEFRW